MILLVKGSGMASRKEVGPVHHENRREYHEAKMEWKDLPGWPGREYAVATTSKRTRLMFERDKPK